MAIAMGYEIEVEHSFDAAHRVVGHEGGKGKCARLHGHTYGVVVTVAGERLDDTGFLVDFAVVKGLIDEWDHRTILWDQDPLRVSDIVARMGTRELLDAHVGIVRVPFNPTAENMAQHLALAIVALPGVAYAAVVLSETPKTRAIASARVEDLT